MEKLLLVLAVVLILVSIVVMGGLIYIIRWHRRPINVDGETYLIPSHLLVALKKQGKDQQNFLEKYFKESKRYLQNEISNQQVFLQNSFAKQNNNLGKSFRQFTDNHSKIEDELKSLENAHAIFRQSLIDKDNEIERLKLGYDTVIHKKFVERFIRLYIELHKASEATDTDNEKQKYQFLIENLKQALSDSDVFICYPEVGDSWENTDKSILMPYNQHEKILTTDQQKHDTIANVISPAFILKGQEKQQTIRASTVTLYTFEPTDNKGE